MSHFADPFHRNTKLSDAQASHRKNSSLRNSVGKAVQPGRVLSKAERQQRRVDRADSAVSTLDGQAEEKPTYETEDNWTGFKAKLSQDIELIQFLEQLGQNIEQNFAPPAGISSVQELRRTRRPYRLRSLIVLIVAFLLVFGTLYTLIEYLLFATRASACSVSTVYFPVTYTITSSMPLASPVAGNNGTTPTTTYTSTTTHTSTLTQIETLTSYLSLQPEAVSSTSETSTGGPSYVYMVNSAGVTEWVNGMSPSSGASLATITTTVVMRPVPPSDPVTSVQSTLTDVETVTPPAYTSTIYSYAGPDLTSTSTSTHYVTVTLSEVSPPASITTTRTSFPGISSGGWNASSSTGSGLDANAEQTQDPLSTTITAISYFGTGHRTTSTHTEFITTTVAQAYTTTISQVIQSPIGSGYVTIITALPVTITPGTGTPLFSTSVTAPDLSSISTTVGGSTVNQGTATPSSISTSSSLNATVSSRPSTYPLLTPGSSGVLPNSTASVAPAGSSQMSANARHGNTQSPGGSKSGTSASMSTPGSITNTVSAAGRTGSQSLSTVSQASSSLGASMSSSSSSLAQITSIASSLRSFVSSRVSANSTSSGIPNASSLFSSSGVSAGPLTTGSPSDVPSNSAPAGSATMSSPLTNSTTSSALYGYSNPASSSTSGLMSLSVANSFTSASKTSNASSSSSPSTLATSTRPASSQVTTNSAANSSASHLSTTSSFSTFNNNSSSLAPATSNSNTPSQTSITATISSGAQPTQTQSIQFSLASNVSTTSTPSATIPFPASSATATPTGGCGEHGDFMVDFDDLPRFLPTNPNNTDITEAAPVFNPYHHLTFSDGYVYAPEPSEPYQPISQPHLAVFLANATGRTASPFGSLVKPGEIGDGPRDPMSAFWFDANSAFFGCDNPGPDACTLVLSAYTWSQFANAEILTYAENVTIPTCTTLTNLNCQLHKVEFPTSFRGLTGLQIQAYTGNDQRMFFIDDLAMRWSNNSCAAGLLRQSSR